jgi:hypothetical protein
VPFKKPKTMLITPTWHCKLFPRWALWARLKMYYKAFTIFAFSPLKKKVLELANIMESKGGFF